MKRFLSMLLFLFLLAPITAAQQPQVKGLPIIKVSQLPSAGPAAGSAYLISDSFSGGCDVGGGSLYIICESSGTAWIAKSVGGVGGTGTAESTWTIDSDAGGVEPADGAGLIIGGGAGPVELKWDAPNNEVDLTGPPGLTLSLPDPGDGSRVSVSQDNTSHPVAPATGFTSIYSLGGAVWGRASGDAAGRRFVQVIDKDVSAITVNGDGEGTTETPIYSFSVPAGTMGATGTLRLTAKGTFTTGAATARVTIRIKFGGTTLWGSFMADQSFIDTTAKPWRMTIELQNLTASSQSLSGQVMFARHFASQQTDGSGTIIDFASNNWNGAVAIGGTSAINTDSAARTLEISAQLGGTSPTNAAVVFVCDTVILEAL